jgi:hypothetical protein
MSAVPRENASGAKAAWHHQLSAEIQGVPAGICKQAGKVTFPVMPADAGAEKEEQIMSLHEEQRRLLERAARNLIIKNTNAFSMLGAAMNGMMNGEFNREIASQVFGFDAESKEPLDELILLSVLNGLDEKDINVIFQRYAQRQGLKF